MKNGAAGPFEILEILGEGSFGTVCVARVRGDPLRRRVALKILKGAYATNEKILNRTRDEARLLSKLNHPNIVRVERLMHVAGRPVVVMEQVEGVSLDQLVLRHKDGLPASIALDVIRHTCMALHVAYTAESDDGRKLKVIHRDIKPSNILLSIHGEVKVVDFGIAKGDFEGREAETQSVVMGSRPYMAPERLDGISDKPAVDVYSAGMSLFELLTGRPMNLSINPVHHDKAMSRQLRFVRVAGMAPEALEDLRDLIRRMCAYDRDHRPTAFETANDLEQLWYAIDPQHRRSLPEFSQTTVAPIYEARPRISPEGRMDGEGDEELLQEITGAITRSEAGSEGGASWTPYLFAAAIALSVVALGLLAGIKLLGPEPLPVAAEDGQVQIRFWLPSDASARVGDARVDAPGEVSVYPGITLVQLTFDSGRTLNCTFVAEEGQGVRYVVDGERGALSINDGPGRPCTVVNPASPG